MAITAALGYHGQSGVAAAAAQVDAAGASIPTTLTALEQELVDVE